MAKDPADAGAEENEKGSLHAGELSRRGDKMKLCFVLPGRPAGAGEH